LEQHWTLVEQDTPVPRQVEAWTAVGDTTEVINGTATSAANPRVRTMSRLVIPASCAGKPTGSANK